MRDSYHTQQKTVLLGFLREHAEGQFTVDEIIAGTGEAAPGKSSTYRILKQLCDEGTVRRFAREGTSSAVYQLTGECCCSEHLHIKCLSCGMVMHLDKSAQVALTCSTGFVIDDLRSMLYGKCAVCAGRAAK